MRGEEKETRTRGCGVDDEARGGRGESRGGREMRGQLTKTLLSARREPTHDLELDGLALEVNGTDLEVDTDSRDVALGVGVVGESKEQAGLADTRVTDEEELERMRVSLVMFSTTLVAAPRWVHDATTAWRRAPVTGGLRSRRRVVGGCGSPPVLASSSFPLTLKR